MRISTAESAIMETLWRRAPLTADEIIERVAAPNDWSEATVKTLLNRLLTKQAIAAERDGRRYNYRPLIARGDYVSAESQNLLDRLFEGS
jgi:BlaI family transcriptional regulator, penicillinase repressor